MALIRPSRPVPHPPVRKTVAPMVCPTPTAALPTGSIARAAGEQMREGSHHV
jgi:hypothetical protein